MKAAIRKLALVLPSLLGLAATEVTAACETLDQRALVFAAEIGTGVRNHIVRGSACTINDLLNQNNNWGNRQEFLDNAFGAIAGLLQAGDVSPSEAIALLAAAQQSAGGKFINVKLLAFNDFHSNIQPPAGAAASVIGPDGKKIAPVGGVAWLAAWIKSLRSKNPNHAVVSAGDLINAAPYVSSLLYNEPTIAAMNEIGLDFNVVGNHEFDRGIAELLRMQHGGCHPVDGCRFKPAFGGAKFSFLAANVVDRTTGKTLFPSYAIKNFKGNKVAFVGVTLRSVPAIVHAEGVAASDFRDEAETANALVAQLRSQGVDSFVLLVHQGNEHASVNPLLRNDFNGCGDVSGDLDEIVARLDPAIGVIVSAHTHEAYVCAKNDRLVTSAGHYGRLLSEIDLQIDTATHKLIKKTARNYPVTHDISADPAVSKIVSDAVAAVAASDRAIGMVAGPIMRDIDFSNESALGDVLADAMLWATADPANGGAIAAFMNPGGIRSDLAPQNNQVMFSHLYNIQPFNNYLITMTLTGAQIKELLEQQFKGYVGYKGIKQNENRVLQVSGIAYSWSRSAQPGSKVSNISIQGKLLDLTANYNVVVNSYMAEGGDNFSVLSAGANRHYGDVDVSVTEAYIKAHSPLLPGAKNRITQLP